MTKVMLVEDDKSLREIYGVRLLAEGYDIVSAGDGEEALAMAIKERPQLIVSDVMMPKISGFDMLDILRSTTETKNIKVIMMTALSSEEQRQRGETLGADRYLVKSQVGIEDVVRAVHEVLEDQPAAAAPAVATAPTTTPSPVAQPAPPPPTATPTPAPVPAAARPAQPAPSAVPPRPPVAPAPAPATVTPAPAPAPAPTPPPPQNQTPKPPSATARVIQPLSDPTKPSIDINQLLDKELAKEAGLDSDAIPTVQTTEQEKEALAKELADFEAGKVDNTGTIPPPPPPPPGAPAT
ncbi:TPA: hypothetical protein DCF80_00045 [Candidatus Saccharibacteria bacterium]|nr:hypothetical protein [Candidatus Saccharibacteria bacterium]HRK41021.1 response regulator [Candidatus Saccharibacteria bacterium]